jgi:hypothetical protein
MWEANFATIQKFPQQNGICVERGESTRKDKDKVPVPSCAKTRMQTEQGYLRC